MNRQEAHYFCLETAPPREHGIFFIMSLKEKNAKQN